MSKVNCNRKVNLCKKIKKSNYPEFYKKVWIECLKIKSGQLSTYSDIAIKIGHPKSARAVGNALGKNPFAPDVPCHRVIRKTGELGGYSGGLAKKIKLLKEENKELLNGKKISVNFDALPQKK